MFLKLTVLLLGTVFQTLDFKKFGQAS